MKKWKKSLLTIVAAGAVFAVMPQHTEAAYSLSEEVATPTPALLAAAQLGVMTSVTPDLQNNPNKDAILVMTFGTTYADTRAKTIDATIAEIQAAHPGTKVVTAYTSHIVIDRVKKKEGITIPTPEEALEQLRADGYTRVCMTSLDVIPGIEYAYKMGVYQNNKHNFKKATLAYPLLYWQGQEEQDDDVAQFIDALAQQFPQTAADEGIVLMAHGTPQIANAYYSVLQLKLQEKGYTNVFIDTVEGWPNLEWTVKQLKANNIKKITIMPMMMVAGDHANNDMAGDGPDSHKSILEANGIKVTPYIHGLGENKFIRDIYVARANAAWNALISD